MRVIDARSLIEQVAGGFKYKNRDGRYVAALDEAEGILHKSVKGSTSFRRSPRAITWDLHIVEHAKGQGATELRVRDSETGVEHIARIEAWDRHAVFLPGDQLQKHLLWEHWQHSDDPQGTLL